MVTRRIRIESGAQAAGGLLARFDAVRGRLLAALPAGEELGKRMRTRIEALAAIDRQYGAGAPLTLEGTDDLVAALLGDLAHAEADLARAGLADPDAAALADLAIGAALWAIAHAIPIRAPEPVANALALRSNQARGREALAAVFGLMQGVIEHVAPQLAPDLERSNPERPWRILHLNLAITAIRTEDPPMMDFAFDRLDRALPAERAGFYAEALALALAPQVAPAVRERIEARHLKWALPSQICDN